MLWRVGSLVAVALAAMATFTGVKEDVSVGIFNRLAAERGVRIEQDVPFGPLARHRLDIYHPTAAAERRPLVMFIYGGGWTSGGRATYAFVGSALAAQGYRTLIADYRLHPEVGFPAFIDDAQAAYQWIGRQPKHAGRPVVVAGHSAGAYIAAMLALDPTRASPAPSALIGLAGPYSFDPTTWPSTRAIFTSAAARPETARPVSYVRRGAPPALLLHGAADTTVKLYNTNDLAAALQGLGTTADVITYAGIGHVGLVTAIARPLRWRAPVLADMLRFLERNGGSVRLQ